MRAPLDYAEATRLSFCTDCLIDLVREALTSTEADPVLEKVEARASQIAKLARDIRAERAQADQLLLVPVVNPTPQERSVCPA